MIRQFYERFESSFWRVFDDWSNCVARLHDLCTESTDRPFFRSSSGPFLRDRNHRLALALIYSSSLMAHIHTSL